MYIACLAWGSLVWNPEDLKISIPWRADGPTLPVEYVRQSSAGHLTLVLTSQGAKVTAMWAEMESDSLQDAVESLRYREGKDNMNQRHIGRWPCEQPYPFAQTIGTWASEKKIDAVIWTALPPKYQGIQGKAPTKEEAVAYLAGLDETAKPIAERYVRATPQIVRTPYREAFERAFGWTPDNPRVEELRSE